MPRGPFSLHSHLALVVLGAVLPCALLTGIIVWRTLESSRAVIEHRLTDAARVDADALDREFNGDIRVLQSLAQSPSLDSGDLASFREEAVRTVGVQQGWFAVILLTPQGQTVVHTRASDGEPLPQLTGPESLQQVLATRRPTVGALTPDQGDPALRFPIRVPVERHGELIYVLTAVMEPESLTPLVRSHLPETEEWTRVIIDPGFVIAARSRGGDQYVGRPITAQGVALIRQPPSTPTRGTSIEGEALYSAISRTSYGWATSVSVPVVVLDGPVRASIRAIVAGGVVLFAGALFSVLFVSRRVARDFAAARDAAAALADGRTPPSSQPRVAEARQVQESLARAAALLQDRSRERDEQLQRAIEAQAQAEDASRTKDQFLAVLGHELRNPLAPALTALELMKLKGGNVLQRERDVLERQIAHMTRLVNDLLDVSRLTRGKVDLMLSRFEMRGAVDRCVDMAGPLIRQHHHRLTIEVPPTGLAIEGDEDRIVQVLVNLVTNAAKYTPPGGHISLVAFPDNDMIELTCADDGPGIADDLLPTIFEPFAQGPRAIDRQQGGLGLGLALARSLTELHGGSLAFEPVASHGSRFVMRLPRAAATVVASPARERVATVAIVTPRRVLVVEDNTDARTMLTAALEDAGHEVQTASDGVSALSVAARFNPDVAILDIGLPRMDGYQVARTMRATYPGLRLIALTGYGQHTDARAAAAAGFDAHCTKPAAIAVLLGEIAAPDQVVSSPRE